MGQIMKEIGELLHHARTSKGMELDDVACQLKVGRTYLTALEEGDISQLPEEVYVLGYLQGYARILGLNGEEVINRYKQDKDIMAIRPNFIFPEEKIQHSYGGRAAKILPAPVVVLVSFLMLAALAVIWYQGNIINKLPNLPFSIMQLGKNPSSPTELAQKEAQ